MAPSSEDVQAWGGRGQELVATTPGCGADRPLRPRLFGLKGAPAAPAAAGRDKVGRTE
ncbi:MAG TPA: hypothetical protein VH229_03305 [Candidatus Udaeobacter sp.]|nr:hypothetical protein [Candidatus Udaeobacter sp.]